MGYEVKPITTPEEASQFFCDRITQYVEARRAGNTAQGGIPQELSGLDTQEGLATLAEVPELVRKSVAAATQALKDFSAVDEGEKVKRIGALEECREQLHFLMPTNLNALFPLPAADATGDEAARARAEREMAEQAAQVLRDFNNQLWRAMQEHPLTAALAGQNHDLIAAEAYTMMERLKEPAYREADAYLMSRSQSEEDPLNRLIDTMRNGITPINHVLYVIALKAGMRKPLDGQDRYVGEIMERAYVATDEPLRLVEEQAGTLFKPDEQEKAKAALDQMKQMREWLHTTGARLTQQEPQVEMRPVIDFSRAGESKGLS